MILLDTDHLTVLQVPDSERRQRLLARLALVTDELIGTTIVNVEEQMRGWLAAIAKDRQARRQVGAYRELGRLFDFFAAFSIAPFDDAAAAKCEQLRAQRVRIATMDLKIAAIALMQAALLLTANRQDFEHVPGLRFANWLDQSPAA
jgi:tRNA(fMet)-specific endonuclease VapC